MHSRRPFRVFIVELVLRLYVLGKDDPRAIREYLIAWALKAEILAYVAEKAVQAAQLESHLCHSKTMSWMINCKAAPARIGIKGFNPFAHIWVEACARVIMSEYCDLWGYSGPNVLDRPSRPHLIDRAPTRSPPSSRSPMASTAFRWAIFPYLAYLPQGIYF